MLQLILPANVASEERFGEAPGDGVLFPEEEKIIAQAVQKRRREYATVRSCARSCLGRLGYLETPILPGDYFNTGGVAAKHQRGAQGGTATTHRIQDRDRPACRAPH